MRILALIGIQFIDAVDLLDGLESTLYVWGLTLIRRPIVARIDGAGGGGIRPGCRVSLILEGVRRMAQ
jgi:hypothetical protein